MRGIWPLALITFKEGVRNRALYGISIFALLLLVANQLVCSMILRDVGKVAIDLSLSAVSFCGLLIVFFVGINLLAKDFERKTLYMVLSRPLSRYQYICGKYLGMAMLLTFVVAILGFFSVVSILVSKALYPSYFDRFDMSGVLLAIVFILVSLLVLCSISFLFSAITSTSFIALSMTIISYLIGQSIDSVLQLLQVKDSVGITVSTGLTKLISLASYLFPDFSRFDYKLVAAHGMPYSHMAVFWSGLYALCYIMLMLVASAYFFNRREFP